MKKNKIIVLVSAIIVASLALFGVSAFALSPQEEATQSYFQADEELQTDDAAVSHSYFSAGNNIVNNKQVDGILFSAGNNLTSNGSAEYAFLAGNLININKEIKKDLFLAGNTVNLNAPIGRDLYLFANTVNINQNISHNAFVAGNNIKIADNVTISGDLHLDGERIELGNNVKVTGLLSYNKESVIKNLNSSNYGTVSTYENPKAEDTGTSPQAKLLSALFSFISALIIFALLVLVFPKIPARFAKITEGAASTAKQLGIGACALILMPTACFFLLFTIIGIPLALILLAFYFIALYASMYISGIYLGHLIITKVFNAKANTYGAIILGIVLITLISIVPVVGGPLTLLAVCLGLGIIIDFIFVRKTQKIPSDKDIKEKSQKIQIATKEKLKAKQAKNTKKK